MREAFKVLLEELEADLSKLELEPDPLKRLGHCLERVEIAIDEVPKREDFEIYYGEVGFLFLKELMPQLFRKLLYYHLRFDLEMHKASSIKREYIRYCENKLGQIRRWLDENLGFIKYYYSKAFEEEEWYVLNKAGGRIPKVLNNYLKFPFQHESAGIVATILAYEDFAKVLKIELQGSELVLKPAKWNGKTIELVEQIMGEYETGHTVVNGQPATQDYLVARAEKMYHNVSLKNFDNLASQARARKARTPYHEKKIQLINARADELLDENQK